MVGRCMGVAVQLGVVGSQYETLSEQERENIVVGAAAQLVSKEPMAQPEDQIHSLREVSKARVWLVTFTRPREAAHALATCAHYV